MSRSTGVVWALDDAPCFLDELSQLLVGQGYKVRCAGDADELFKAGPPQVPTCLLLDLHLGNDGCGMWVHEELRKSGWEIPTLILASDWTVRTIVDAMRAGAEGFIAKPYQTDELLDAVSAAMARALELHRRKMREAEASERAAALTARERNVVAMVVGGFLNKEIADQLGLSLVTVKVHRARAMQKLQAGNPADLARIAGLAGVVVESRGSPPVAWHPEGYHRLLAG